MLQVRTGSRLHFGLMELAAGQPLRFGGWGMMVSQPNLMLQFSSTPTLEVPTAAEAELTDGEVQSRIRDVLRLRAELPGKNSLRFDVHVVEALPMHHGLGAGTQLAAATAAGIELIDKLSNQSLPPAADRSWQPLSATMPTLTPRWLVRHAGRGLRSAVGLQGFVHGGLILDEGYAAPASDDLSTRSIVAHSQRMPAAWRVVLISPDSTLAVSGGQETELLSEIGQQPNSMKSRMLEIAKEAMFLAGQDVAFDAWIEHLEEYMRLAASVFCKHQGGTYNGAAVAQAAELAEQAKLRGVGQSSWGPTVFGFAANAEQAESAANWLRNQRDHWKVTVTTPLPVGAQWRWLPAGD